MIQAPQSTIDGTHEREYSSSENINNVPRRRRTMLESGDVTKLASAQHVVCDTHARRVVCKRISRSHRFNDVCRRHESTWISVHLLAKLGRVRRSWRSCHRRRLQGKFYHSRRATRIRGDSCRTIVGSTEGSSPAVRDGADQCLEGSLATPFGD